MYVFGNTGKDLETQFLLKASSESIVNNKAEILPRGTDSSNSRYGYALVNLGLLNDDEYEDFAVGAPLEENGAVYVYFGSASFWFHSLGGYDKGMTS